MRQCTGRKIVQCNSLIAAIRLLKSEFILSLSDIYYGAIYIYWLYIITLRSDPAAAIYQKGVTIKENETFDSIKN